MKSNKIFNFFLPALLIIIISVISMSSRVFNKTGNIGGGTNNNVPDNNITIYLNGISGLPRPANIRNFPCPATPYLGMGSNNYAKSLDDLPFSKFYCVITVTNIENSSWGKKGEKTTVWDTGNNQKTIAVPGKGAYRIKVDYYEQYNTYWANTTRAARGRWFAESTFVSGDTKAKSFGIYSFGEQLFPPSPYGGIRKEDKIREILN